MSSSIYEIKKVTGYDDLLADKRISVLYYLGAATICGMLTASFFEPEKVNELINTALKTSATYLPAEFANRNLGVISAIATGYNLSSMLSANKEKKTIKRFIKQIENYESMKNEEDIETITK